MFSFVSISRILLSIVIYLGSTLLPSSSPPSHKASEGHCGTPRKNFHSRGTALHRGKDLAVSLKHSYRECSCEQNAMHFVLAPTLPWHYSSCEESSRLSLRSVSARTSWIAPDGSYPLPLPRDVVKHFCGALCSDFPHPAHAGRNYPAQN